MKVALWIAGLLLATSAPVAQTANGTIEGTVVQFGTAVPVGNAEVSAIFEGKIGKDQQRDTRSRADQDGHFSLKNLRPGRYLIRPYFSGDSARDPLWITLRAGQQIRDVRLSLTLSGTIHGRIQQPDGKAARALRVDLFKPVSRFGGDFLEIASQTETDASGEYQFHVKAGKYYVRTRPSPAENTHIYFPGTLELGKAMPIEVSQGKDVRADIQFSENPRFNISLRITGNITDPGERHISAVYLIDRNSAVRELVYLPTGCTCPPAYSELEPAVFATLSKDQFEIRGVRPGSYEVIAEVLIGDVQPGLISLLPLPKYSVIHEGQTSIAVSGSYEAIAEVLAGNVQPGELMSRDRPGYSVAYEGRTSVDIITNDVVDLTIDLHRRATIEGRMISSGKGSSPRDSWVYLFDRNGRPQLSSQVDKTGRFFFSSVAEGDYRIFFRVWGDAYVVDVRQRGLSIYDSGLKVTGAGVEPLEVLINHAGGVIEGVVEDGGTATFSVVLVPAAPRKPSGLIPVARAIHDDFKFNFRGVPAGDYRLFAFDNAALDAEYDKLTSDSFMAQYESQGVPVTVKPASPVSVRLRPLAIH